MGLEDLVVDDDDMDVESWRDLRVLLVVWVFAVYRVGFISIWPRLVFILVGALFYGTVTFRKKTRVLKYW